jgi:uncharacterized damage-inducible protein DinB
MQTEIANKNELFTAIEEEVSHLTDQVSPLDENMFNTVPYTNSWTAGQLLQHVTLSTEGMAKAMSSESKSAERDPGQRIPELKKIFLDFSKKLKSPDFIVPEAGPDEKQATVEALYRSFEQLKKNTTNANLTDLVEGLPLGPITKLEILHFVLYHTQRHLHQMKKIIGALTSTNVST